MVLFNFTIQSGSTNKRLTIFFIFISYLLLWSCFAPCNCLTWWHNYQSSPLTSQSTSLSFYFNFNNLGIRFSHIIWKIVRVKRCIPVNYSYLPNALFATVHTSQTSIFVYYRYKYIVAKIVILRWIKSEINFPCASFNPL
jgi:hypothetical protein